VRCAHLSQMPLAPIPYGQGCVLPHHRVHPSACHVRGVQAMRPCPLSRLTPCLGFYTLARTPCQVLGQNPSQLGSHPCRGGFRFDPLLASPRAARAQGRDPSLTLEGAFHLLRSGDGEDFPQLAVQPVLPVSGPPAATATFWLALAKTGHCLPSQLMVGGHYLGLSLGGGKVDC
jgi:hypothetical protein